MVFILVVRFFAKASKLDYLLPKFVQYRRAVGKPQLIQFPQNPLFTGFRQFMARGDHMNEKGYVSWSPFDGAPITFNSYVA